MIDNDSEHTLVLERDFDAPVELVWDMWADPVHFARWYGPDGASVPRVEFDLRPQGRRFVCMEVNTPSGPRRMYFVGAFTEVVERSRLSYTEAMCDEHGNVADPAESGEMAGHPVVTEVRIVLRDRGGRTSMRLTHIGVPPGSPGAAGWGAALDKIDAQLRSIMRRT